MTIETRYIAFDDREFYTESACRDYEDKVQGWIDDLARHVVFYHNGREMEWWTDDINNALNELWNAWNDCHSLKVRAPLTEEEIRVAEEYEGVIIPHEVGYYVYDEEILDWVKTEELDA